MVSSLVIGSYLVGQGHQLFFRGETELVFRGQDLGLANRQSHLHHGIMLLRTKQDANGLVFFGEFLLVVKVVYVHLERPISCASVRQFSGPPERSTGEAGYTVPNPQRTPCRPR